MDVLVCICTGVSWEMKAQLGMARFWVLGLLWTSGTFNSVTCVHKTWCSPPEGYYTVVQQTCLYMLTLVSDSYPCTS